jgi:sugar phosphate permease
MDGLRGLVGFQWMFLLYGLCAIILGVALLWWLPDRPLARLPKLTAFRMEPPDESCSNAASGGYDGATVTTKDAS